MGFVAYYPLKGDKDEVIEQSATIIEDTMTIMSGYNITRTQTSLDILQTYEVIPISIWIALLFSYFAFSIILSSGFKLIGKRRQRTDAFWISACAFLEQNSFPSSELFSATLSSFFTISLFFVVSFITCSLGTDLVVIDKPKVLDSYGDILEAGAKVAFSDLFAEKGKFEEFAPGSLERKLADNSFEMKMDPEAVTKVKGKILNQQAVVIGRESLAVGGAYPIIYAMKDSFPDFRILRVQDHAAAKYTNAIPWSKQSDHRFQSITSTV